jgi:hypothetical protein
MRNKKAGYPSIHAAASIDHGPLFQDVAPCARYRDSQGDWYERWTTQAVAFSKALTTATRPIPAEQLLA